MDGGYSHDGDGSGVKDTVGAVVAVAVQTGVAVAAGVGEPDTGGGGSGVMLRLAVTVAIGPGLGLMAAARCGASGVFRGSPAAGATGAAETKGSAAPTEPRPTSRKA